MTTKPTPLPTAPRGLAPGGRLLWRSVLAGYEVSPIELRELRSLCFVVDEIDRMDAAIRESPLVVKGGRGAMVPHPLLVEVRRHREVFAKLLTALLADDSAGGRGDASSAARRMALKRHHGSPHGLGGGGWAS